MCVYMWIKKEKVFDKINPFTSHFLQLILHKEETLLYIFIPYININKTMYFDRYTLQYFFVFYMKYEKYSKQDG